MGVLGYLYEAHLPPYGVATTSECGVPQQIPICMCTVVCCMCGMHKWMGPVKQAGTIYVIFYSRP